MVYDLNTSGTSEQHTRIPNWDEIFTMSMRKVDPDTHARIKKLRYAKRPFIMKFGYKVAQYFDDPSFRKFINISWSDLIEFLSSQMIENRQIRQTFDGGYKAKELKPFDLEGRFKLNRRFSQLPCTRHTVQKRIEKAAEFCSKDEPVLLLGDDDFVSIGLAESGFTNIHVIDIDQKVLDSIDEIAKENNFKISVHHQDLSKKLSSDIPRNFKLVFFDPFYSLEGVNIFLNAARESTEEAVDPTYFLSIHLMSLMRNGISELDPKLKDMDTYLYDFIPNFNVYPVPKSIKFLVNIVNNAVVRSSVMRSEGSSFRFFTSDALILKKRI